jgi:hypothetical protein
MGGNRNLFLAIFPSSSGDDLNYDGLVNFNDFAVLANHWLESF